MKKNKFLLFALLPLTCFGIIGTFLFPSFKAYSQEKKISSSKIDNSECETKYKVHSNEKVPPEKEVYPEAQAYCNALANTKIATDEKIWRKLTAIVKNNGNLKWEGEDKEVKDRVLVTVWKNPKRYKDEKGNPKGEITAQREIWVTVYPDLYDFCKEYDRGKKISLPYRLNQVLGLAPETHKDEEKKRSVVEIWVKPKDLFRPTPDPEITDHEAELYFPLSYSWALSVTYDYKLWFLNQLMTNDYPWTKLGYTYDWGKKDDWNKIDPKRPKNVGLSEFIIRKGAPIKIQSINTAEEYCEKEHTVSS